MLLRPHLLVGVASVHAIHDRDGVGSVKSVSSDKFRSSLETVALFGVLKYLNLNLKFFKIKFKINFFDIIFKINLRLCFDIVTHTHLHY